MPFQQGNQFGKHTKRGEAKVKIEVKEKLTSMSDNVYKALEEGIIRGDFQYVKLWFEYCVGKPRITQEIIEQREQSLFLSADEREERILELIKEKGYILQKDICE